MLKLVESMAELLINGKDAISIGVRMGEGFINELRNFYPMKEYVTNESRLENGRRIIYGQGKKDYREVSLIFTVEADNPDIFSRNLQSFEDILYGERVQIEVPQRGLKRILTYRKSTNFAGSYDNTFCKVMVRFTEDIIEDDSDKT